MFQFKGRGGKELVFLVPRGTHYFYLTPFPIQTHSRTSQIQTSQFRRTLKEVVRVIRKRRTSQPVHIFIILPQKAVLIPHHAEAEAVPVHIYRGKKPNHVNNEALDHSPLLYNIPIISKLSLKELFLSCSGGEGRKMLLRGF